METEVTAERIKIYCPQHQTIFEIPHTPKIVCEIREHALSNDFPNEEFWEHCCDCQTFSPSDLEVGGVAKLVCVYCERPTVSCFVCGNCKIVSNDSGEDTKGKIFTLSFDSKTIEPSCPGCAKTYADIKLLLHKCNGVQAAFLTSRQICPFCKKETVRSKKNQTALEKPGVICPQCKILNSAEVAFCVNCGEKLHSDITSPLCATYNRVAIK